MRRKEQRQGHQQGQEHCQDINFLMIIGVGMCVREQWKNGATSARTDQGETRSISTFELFLMKIKWEFPSFAYFCNQRISKQPYNT